MLGGFPALLLNCLFWTSPQEQVCCWWALHCQEYCVWWGIKGSMEDNMHGSGSTRVWKKAKMLLIFPFLLVFLAALRYSRSLGEPFIRAKEVMLSLPVYNPVNQYLVRKGLTQAWSFWSLLSQALAEREELCSLTFLLAYSTLWSWI